MSDVGVLLPLRVETRFKNGDLWVRIVPDEPWFVREDPRITDDELLALRRYAAAPGDAGADGIPSAWHSLAAQVTAPRAVFLHRRFISTAPDGSLVVRTPAPAEMRSEPALPRVSEFPAELIVWIGRARGTVARALTLTVNRARLLADFADPDLPGDRRWWEDWDEAVAVGLAGIIPAAALQAGIDALYVTGLGGADPAAHFTALVAEGRLGLLEPGTPTNSVDGAPAAPLATDAATWWNILQSPPGDADLDVSRALTGDPALLGNMPGGERPQRAPASALVTAMWPALWGFAASQVFDIARGPAVARWAGQALFPEGAYPIVRIGPQPYGLLPATVWSAWEAATGDPSFEAPLIGALRQLRPGHLRAARARGTVAGQDVEGLLDRIADTPTSSRFRFRQALPLELWWLGMVGSGVAQQWRALVQTWAEAHPLAADIGLQPLRRYAARGRSRRVGIPLVVPGGTRPDALGGLLGKLAAAALQSPASFANTTRLESDVLQLNSSSLLIRLAIRSLQLLIADTVREREDIDEFDPEPFSRNSRLRGRMEQLIAQATPADRQNPTRTERHLMEVAAALRSVGAIPIPSLERMLAATIDCSNHRIDAWFLAPAQRRFDDASRNAATTRRLGAYGWVDQPRPGSPGPTAAGLLHAPSPSAALAAAVVRDRSISEGGGRWQLDITSRSARAAERLAQHVRVGAHLAEALGREIERIVARTPAIEQLRRNFPVRTEHAGKRVCDGLRILAQNTFPVPLNAAQQEQLGELREGLDAYGDLLVADAVHHLVEGRSEVASAVMNAAAGLGRPPELSLLRTPREGRAVSTSVVLALDHVDPQPLPASDTDRAALRPAVVLDPSVAAFVRSQAGAAADWTFDVVLSNGGQPVHTQTVRLADLGLDPVDALALTRARLDGLAVERVAETEDFDLGAEGASGTVAGGTAAARYERAAGLVGLIGRNPAGARALTEPLGDPNPPADVVDPALVARYARAREAGAALVRRLRAQVALLGADGGIGGANPATLRQLAIAAARWGVAPDPPRRPRDPGAPPVTAADRRRERLVDRSRLSLRLLEQRLAAAPEASAAGQSTRDEFLDTAAALVSPTGQVALTGTTRADSIPPVVRAGGPRGLDADWLTVVAAVRPALARLEAHQLTASAPLRAWTNRASDPWQTDAADARRLIAVYAARQLDFSTMPPGAPVAIAAIDRFSEVIPSPDVFTGAAFGFDAPAARAQQAILLAVPPDADAPLDQDTLVRIVAETRELAHARMARPIDLDRQFWGLAPTGLLTISGAIATKLEVRE
jgi:hypothetical protein